MTWKFIRFAHWRAWLAVAATLISLTAAVRPAVADTRVTCTYTVSSSWIGGFSANVDITNNGPAISGWTLRWTFLTPTSLGAVWNAGLTEDGGRAVATNMSFNTTIGTGQVTSFGWTASAASTAVPTDLTINGERC
jgi:cellulase/cellobiase CelA1